VDVSSKIPGAIFPNTTVGNRIKYVEQGRIKAAGKCGVYIHESSFYGLTYYYYYFFLTAIDLSLGGSGP
jgi:hypothetical protein